MSVTIRYLQEYIKSKDHRPEQRDRYFMKLVEEVGELSRAMLRDAPKATEDNIKGTIEEEIWDVMYYVIALANFHDIDIEKWIHVKERINNERYNQGVVFDPPQE